MVHPHERLNQRTALKKQVKPFSLHLSLLLFVFLYASLGGFVIQRLERDTLKKRDNDERKYRHGCIRQILAGLAKKNDAAATGREDDSNATIAHITECFRVDEDERSKWSMVTGTLYGFGIITTLGYNRIEPKTLESRLFCVIYGIIGIPITMIIIANIGQHLNQFAGDTRKMLEAHLEKKRRDLNAEALTEDDIPDTTTELMAFALLVTFLIYTCIGAILLPLLNGEFDFFNGIYYNFLCLTAIDFGQLVPIRYAYLPITFLYVCVGLAITTIAINVGSEYVRKLHNFGKRVKNVATTKVWFGGKTLRVKELLHAVGKKCGVDPAMIDHMDLENIVERVVAIREGREPPPDLNENANPIKSPISQPEDSSTQESSNDDSSEDDRPPTLPKTAPPLEFIIRRPILQTISSNSASDFNPQPFDVSNFVAIDMELSDELNREQAVVWEKQMVIGRPDERVVEREELTSPDQLQRSDAPVVLLGKQNEEPRLFKEKKKKYGRDPKRLHATYREEWDRLERLGTQLGPRRKSLLALQDVTAIAQATPLAKPAPADEPLDEKLRLKKKNSSKKKRSLRRKNAAATSASASTKSGIKSAEDKVHRLSVVLPDNPGLLVGRDRSPTPLSSADRRRSSATTPRKLSPLLLKKFGDAIIKTDETTPAELARSGENAPATSASAKRVVISIPSPATNFVVTENKIFEPHMKLRKPKDDDEDQDKELSQYSGSRRANTECEPIGPIPEGDDEESPAPSKYTYNNALTMLRPTSVRTESEENSQNVADEAPAQLDVDSRGPHDPRGPQDSRGPQDFRGPQNSHGPQNSRSPQNSLSQSFIQKDIIPSDSAFGTVEDPTKQRSPINKHSARNQDQDSEQRAHFVV